MGSVQSEEYNNIKIIEVINEYTIKVEVDNKDENSKHDKKSITVKLKGIEPYDWTKIDELEKSRRAREKLDTLSLTKKN